MSKRRKEATMNFGARLAELRKAAGYTQVEFAQDVGISQRMVAYYEDPAAHPPAHLLPDMARVLGVSADELLGLAPLRCREVLRRKLSLEFPGSALNQLKRFLRPDVVNQPRLVGGDQHPILQVRPVGLPILRRVFIIVDGRHDSAIATWPELYS